MEGTDAAVLTSATEKLTQIAMKIGEAVYKAGAEAGEQPAAGGKPADDNVVDADFEEVDDKKKKSA